MIPPPASIPADEDTVPYALAYRETVEILRDVAVAEAEAARGKTLTPAEVEASLRAECLL